MTREIIVPKSENYYISIPKEYINKKIEILVLPFEDNWENTDKTTEEDILLQTQGILSTKKIDPIEWQKTIRNEYER